MLARRVLGVALAACVVWMTPRASLAADDVAAAQKAAAERSAAEMLPASTLVYAEVEHPAEMIRIVLDHPLRKRLEQSSNYKQAFDTPQFKEFEQIVQAVEQRSGVKWRKALEVGTGGGFAIAFDPPTEGVVILAKSTDPKTSESVRDALFDLAREDAKNKGNPDPVQTKEYRGLTAYKVGDSVVANVGPWMIISNKPNLGKAIADRLFDEGESLAKDSAFVEARKLELAKGAGERGTAWAFVRLAPLRLFAASNPIFDENAKSDNPVAELLLGGLAGSLRRAPYLAGSLLLKEQGVKLTVTSPNDRSWIPKGREFFFAPTSERGGGADKALRPKGTLLSITTYRDLARWWEAGPDTYTEGVAAKMAQADSGLSNFLGGKSFGGDVLGSFGPQIQFVVTAQDFKAAGVPEPSIRLPAGALVLRLKEKEAAKAGIAKHMRVAFQSLVALGNLDGASKGRPLLEMKTDRRAGAEILYATYEAPGEDDAKPQAADKAAPGGAKAAAEKDIYYNFSPALVISKDRLMLCSTKQIAQDLVDQVAKDDAAGGARVPQNTLVEISAQPIGEMLLANREQLVAQNMLEKGHDRTEAEKEIDVFIALVSAVREARLSLVPTDKTVSLEVEVKLADPK
jgi:hypothetical protein